jgi:hypothetical protein
VSEGYEAYGGVAGQASAAPRGLATTAVRVGASATALLAARAVSGRPRAVPCRATAAVAVGPGPDDTQNPFLGHTFRVSGLRDELRARRAAPDGWIRHA